MLDADEVDSSAVVPELTEKLHDNEHMLDLHYSSLRRQASCGIFWHHLERRYRL